MVTYQLRHHTNCVYLRERGDQVTDENKGKYRCTQTVRILGFAVISATTGIGTTLYFAPLTTCTTYLHITTQHFAILPVFQWLSSKRQAMYIHVTSEGRSRDNFWTEKAIIVKYSKCVCSLRYPACSAHAPYCHLWSVRLYRSSPHYLKTKQQNFRKPNYVLYLFSIIFGDSNVHFWGYKVSFQVPCEAVVLLTTAHSGVTVHCLSVRLSAREKKCGSKWKDFHEIPYLKSLRKPRPANSIFIKILQEYRVPYMKTNACLW